MLKTANLAHIGWHLISARNIRNSSSLKKGVIPTP